MLTDRAYDQNVANQQHMTQQDSYDYLAEDQLRFSLQSLILQCSRERLQGSATFTLVRPLTRPHGLRALYLCRDVCSENAELAFSYS